MCIIYYINYLSNIDVIATLLSELNSIGSFPLLNKANVFICCIVCYSLQVQFLS